MGLIGVIYQYKSTGGAWIATSVGLLSNGKGEKSVWWIPSDKYLVKAGPNQEWNLPPELASIQQAIQSGNYDKDNPTLVTIQQAHQQLIEAIGPVGKSKCGCKGGNCKKGKCGFIKKISNVQVSARAMEIAMEMNRMVINLVLSVELYFY